MTRKLITHINLINFRTDLATKQKNWPLLIQLVDMKNFPRKTSPDSLTRPGLRITSLMVHPSRDNFRCNSLRILQ